jgi:hypothetical protein
MGAWVSVCCECCVLSGIGPCDELITSPEESYRLWFVVVCDLETSWMRRPCPLGVVVPEKGKLLNILDPFANPAGCATWGLGLRPSACWDCGVRFPTGAWITVPYVCCVLSGRGLCVGLINCPEESYRLWCIALNVNANPQQRADCRDMLHYSIQFILILIYWYIC